jgi:subfamily B ATP-binding cassette protein MsbA
MASDLRAPPSGPGFRKLGELLRPYVVPLLGSCALVVLDALAGLVAPRLAGSVVDTALAGSTDNLNRIALLLLGLFAALGLVVFAQHYLLEATGARLLFALRAKLFAHLLRLTPEFYEARRIGELLSRLGADLMTFQRALTGQIPGGIQATISFVGSLALLLILNARLTFLTMAIVPPVVLLALWFGSRLGRLATRVQDALADTTSVAEEALAGLRTVQSFTREPQESDRYQARLGDLLRLQIGRIRLEGAFSGLLQTLAFSSFAVVLWFGGWLIAHQELTPGDLTAFLLYTLQIAGSVGSLGGLWGSYKELRGASARVFELIETPPALTDPPTPVVLSSLHGQIAFKSVSFCYPSGEGHYALQKIDLDVSPGEVVALVGPSGAGKSTLFSLLLRFFDPTSGAVLLDGHDLRSLRLADLRGAIGLVPQDIFLFSGTVEENLRYGNPEATTAQVRAAAEAAGAARFIEQLPKGYAEVVGERGVRLSAGQRQRLAIARAFLKAPAVLLLDEATSALDAESEETIQKALTALWAGRAVLVIAHRLATAQRADRIVVLDQGRIVGSGTHESLYAANALYRRYWELQALPGSPRD